MNPQELRNTNNQTALDPQSKDYSRTAKAILKITAKILLILIAILFVMSGGNFSENGSGAVWWLLILVVPIIPILLFISLVYALLGAIRRNRDKKKMSQEDQQVQP